MNGIEENLVLLAIKSIVPIHSCTVERYEGRRTWRVRSTCGNVGYVVKFYKETSSGFMREVRALRDFGKISSLFRMPVLFRHGILPGTSTAFVVMDELQGYTLDSLMRGRGCERRGAFSLIGRVLSAFHELVPLCGIPKDSVSVRDNLIVACEAHIRVLETCGEMKMATWARNTRHRLEQSTHMPEQVVFCHGDLHPKNLLVNYCYDILSFKPGLVDFESVRIGTREFDIAKSIVVSGAMDLSDITAIIAGYGDCNLDGELLSIYQAFHAIDGWLYGGFLECRDHALWNKRVLRYASHLST